MKLTEKQQTFIVNVLTTCHAIGINSVIIEPTMVRAASDDRKTLLLTEILDPELVMPTTFGITPVQSLSARMQLIDGVIDTTVTTHKTDDRAVTINIKSGKLSVGFRCSMPTLIKAPSKLNEIEPKLIIPKNEELSSTISRGVKALGAETFSIKYSSKQNLVSVEVVDINDERMVIELTDVKPTEREDEDGNVVIQQDFEHLYTKDVISILQKVESDIHITERGMLLTKINGLQIALVPMMRG